MKREQAGFTIVEVVLVVLLVAAIGAAGYFAYKAHGSKTNKAPAETASLSPRPSSSAQPSASPKPSPSPLSTPISTAGYLLISQWGVMIPDTGALNGLEYSISGSTAFFTTSDLYPAYPQCAATSSAVGLGDLYRAPVSKGGSDAVASIAGYNYFFNGAQMGCGGSQSAAEEQALSQAAMELRLAP